MEIYRDPPPLQVLRGMDFNVVAFNYRIYADPLTRIAPRESGVVRDSHAVYKWLSNRAVGKVGSCLNEIPKQPLGVDFPRGYREISLASGMDFPIPPSFWWSTDDGHIVG